MTSPVLNPRNFMHRRSAKHLRFHEREFNDLYAKAMGDELFISQADVLKLNSNEIAEAYVLFLAGIAPANMDEITA